MKEYIGLDAVSPPDITRPAELTLSGVSVGWPDGETVLRDISFSVHPGQIIGVTGPVACGKSTLGKAFIGEVPYCGSIRVAGRELRDLSHCERSRLISYMKKASARCCVGSLPHPRRQVL